MPLRSLFSKKNKSRTDIRDSTPASPTTTGTESPLTSPTSEYIKPDNLIPSSPNGRNTLHPYDAFNSPTKSTKSSVYPSVAGSPASSSRLRLPFGRKRPAKSSASSNAEGAEDPLPRPPILARLSTGAASESDAADLRRNLGPPPSRSAVFGAYGDSNGAISTKSLPTASAPLAEHPLEPSEITPTPKRPLFPWASKSQPNTAKVKNKSKFTPSKAEDISAALEDPSSFNLKAFRHVRAPSPEHPPPPELSPPSARHDSVPRSANSSSTSLVPPRPIPGTRSRNSSVGSLNDPSASQQRISVAAFREAQARRSQAGSPVPGARSPSPGPNLTVHRSPPSDYGGNPRPRRSSMVALGNMGDDSDSDESEEGEGDDSDTDIQTKGRSPRNNFMKSKAKSEVGHGSSFTSHYSSPKRDDMPSVSPSAFSGPGARLRPDAAAKAAAPRSQSDLYGQGGHGHNKIGVAASSSTDALPPIPNAVKASKQAAVVQPKPIGRPIPKAISVVDSDSDSDNAPLATLVPPKRPGSAASSRSLPQKSQSDANSIRSQGTGPRSRVDSNMMPKPLIDINELTGRNRRPLESGAASSKKEKSQEGFTAGATLLSAGTTQGASSIHSPVPSSVTSTSPPGRRFISPPSSPVSSERQLAGPESKTSPVAPGMVPRRLAVGRKDTDTMSIMSSTTASSSNDGSSGGKKKDLFSERLSKVVAQSVGSPGTSPVVPPLPKPTRRGTAPINISNPSLDTSGGLDIPFTSSPSPILGRPGLGHRRASSDVVAGAGASSVVEEEQPLPRAPSPPKAKPVAIPVSKKPAAYARKASMDKPRKSQESTGTMEDLADLLGAGIKLVSLNGEDEPDLSLPFGKAKEGKVTDAEETESPTRLAYDDPPPSPDRIAPILIKTRLPPPAFSVTSRPQHGRGASVSALTTSSTTAVSPGATTTTTTTTTSLVTRTQTQTRKLPSAGVTRPRSSTLVPTSPSSNSVLSSNWSMVSASANTNPPKPRAPPSGASVAGASTASSSSASTSTSADSGSRSSGYGSTPSQNKRKDRLALSKPPPRSRSVNNMPSIPASPNVSRFPTPSKPFATQSPASSTGDSSSGRGAPITPRDGSDIGSDVVRRPSPNDQWSSGVSGLSLGGKHARKRSIAFEDEDEAAMDVSSSGKGKGKESPEHGEARRKERRRSEARAAIELGNTINGRGPILDDDDDEDLPISQTAAGARINNMSPMMMGGGPMMPGAFGPAANLNPGWGWPPSMPQMPQMPPSQILSPTQFMVPSPSDPSFFAAHQQAMMFAKQAYQMAVAQQAMAAAAEEWERGSTVGGGFSSSQSMYGVPASASPSMYGMGGGNGWSNGSVIMPSSSRPSMYGGSGAMSEYGGGGGRGGGWGSSRSVYGESFGPSSAGHTPQGHSPRARLSSHTTGRDSGYFPPVPPIPQGNKNAAPRQSSSHNNPRARTVSQPANPRQSHHEGGPVRRAPPPSSWKTGGA